jgi:hypothetical protein
MRQFRHIKMMKRAGRGNIRGGVASTACSDLAIACPACPHPSVNLPDKWEDVDTSLKYGCQSLVTWKHTLTPHRFMYALFLALDANFRLKNRFRSSDAKDPGLHTGLAYFVENKAYKTHILKYTSQTDVCAFPSPTA